jgi:hypothetical protein
VLDVDSSHTGTERRRTERVSQSLPVIIRGIDLLGQPFEERSSTVNLNLHGCRYASKYHLPKNTWVTLEIPHGAEREYVRARIAWIQRPRSIRELFQIAVELETPGNFWALGAHPADWSAERVREYSPEKTFGGYASSQGSAEGKRRDMDQGNPETSFSAETGFSAEQASAGDSPLLREWRAEIERGATATVEKAAANAVEQIRAKLEEFERERANAAAAISSELAAKEQTVLEEVRAEFDRGANGIRELLRELESSVGALRAENQAAADSISRLAQTRSEAEAAQSQSSPEPPPAQSASVEPAIAELRERIQSELFLAQSQWSELLQSSLDGSVERLVKELSGRSLEILHEAEQRLSERLAELRQPLAHISSTAQDTLAGVKTALDQEVTRARASLADIDHSANRMKEYAAQLESTSHHALNELHGRIENIVEGQTEEMKRRVETLIVGVSQRVEPALESLTQQRVERAIAEIDSKIAPRLERVSESLRELAAREAQTEESLRLHRERLRQMADANHREASSQMAAALENLRGEFGTARNEALTNWNDELDAASVRAAQAAAEAIGRSSEWFQQEARSRMQVLVEQAAANAAAGLDEKAADASRRFDAHLEERSNARVAEIQQQLESVAGEVSGRTRGQLDAAAEAAAASFGQVIREVSERETQQFTDAGRSALADRAQELQSITGEHLQKLYAEAGASMEQFHSRIASELDTHVARGRDSLAAEFAKAAENFRAERESREAAWSEAAGRIGAEAAARFQERLQNAADSWAVSSVRKINERGQSAVESLLRSADHALRDSFARVFEDLSEKLRENSPAGEGGGQAHAAGFIPLETEPSMPPPPSEGASASANA